MTMTMMMMMTTTTTMMMMMMATTTLLFFCRCCCWWWWWWWWWCRYGYLYRYRWRWWWRGPWRWRQRRRWRCDDDPAFAGLGWSGWSGGRDRCWRMLRSIILTMMLLPEQLRTFPRSMQRPGQCAAHLTRGVDVPVAYYTCAETLAQFFHRKKVLE